MFIINWFKSLLEKFSFTKKQKKLIFLGLENAGKSSLMIRLKYDRFTQVDPTIHPKTEEISIGKATFKAYDLGGHPVVMKLWDQYSKLGDAIVFMVDATSQETLPKAKEELQKLIEDERLQDIPILIFGNKIDKKDCLSEEQLREALEIKGPIKDLQGRNKVEIFMCTVAKNFGILDGFKWLDNLL